MSAAINCLPLGQLNILSCWLPALLQYIALYAITPHQKYKTEKRLLTKSCPDVLSIFTEYQITAVLYLPCDKINELLQFCHDYICTILHLHFLYFISQSFGWNKKKHEVFFNCILRPIACKSSIFHSCISSFWAPPNLNKTYIIVWITYIERGKQKI